MSLILDALRKMEQERRSRRGVAQDLRPEGLRYRTATQPKQPSRYPLVIVGVVLLCAGIGAGFALKGNKGEAVSQARQDAAAMSAAPAPTPSPVEAPAVVPPAFEPAAAPEPAVPNEPVAAPLAAEPAKPRPARPVALPSSPAPVAATPFREDAGAQGGGADITISGIAYQDERRMRRAVLNGQLVGEGAEIAGARVVEIKETKVKLSRGGQLFEVPFSSGQSR